MEPLVPLSGLVHDSDSHEQGAAGSIFMETTL